MWRGGLGSAYLLPALSSAGASLAGPCSVCRVGRWREIGLRLMPPFPPSPLSSRTADFPQYGWKVGICKLSGSAFPRVA